MISRYSGHRITHSKLLILDNHHGGLYTSRELLTFEAYRSSVTRRDVKTEERLTIAGIMRGVGRSDINLDIETEAVTRVRHLRL